MRFVFTGGGTGGHLYPAIATHEALMRLVPTAQCAYVGARTGIEARVAPELGIEFVGVATRKVRRNPIHPSTVLALVALVRGTLQCRSFYRRFRPSAVLGTGGYVAAAAVLAAQRMGIPTAILAPDAVPGRTNLIMSKRADRVCTWLGHPHSEYPASSSVATGFPVRSGVLEPVDKGVARRCLGLDESRPTLFVTGGSQGAMGINHLVASALGHFQEDLQVLHQTGPNQQLAAVQLEKLRCGYVAMPFLDEKQMPLALAAADLVVSRSGASTLAELTGTGIPSILIPLPTAYADHQTANARCVEAAGAALLLSQPQLAGETLAQSVLSLLGDECALQRMSVAATEFGRPGAADTVARILLDLGA